MTTPHTPSDRLALVKGKPPTHPLGVLLAVLVGDLEEFVHPTRTTPRPALPHAEDHDGQDPDEQSPSRANGAA